MEGMPLILRALSGLPIDRAPVWMMRQAGRYLLEYRQLKSQHTFLEMCKTPDLAFEVTMQPLRILDVDAAILFSDILLPLECLGLEIDFTPGPIIKRPIRGAADVSSLMRLDVGKQLKPVLKTLTMLRKEVDRSGKAILGFAGAPWTLACYSIDQGVQKHFQGTQVFARRFPAPTAELLERLTQLITQYCLLQWENGAQVIQLFDTWAGNLSTEDYARFALPYTKRILAALAERGIPTLLYINSSVHLLSQMGESGAAGLSLDWRISLEEAQRLVPETMAVQGNLDPTCLFGTREEVEAATAQMIRSWKQPSRYIANLGHGVLQETPVENALAFVNTVKKTRLPAFI